MKLVYCNDNFLTPLKNEYFSKTNYFCTPLIPRLVALSFYVVNLPSMPV